MIRSQSAVWSFVLLLMTRFAFRDLSAVMDNINGDEAPVPTKHSDSPPCIGESNCRSSDYCFKAGDFTATIVQMSDGAAGNYRRIRLNLRFQNLTDHVLILAYHAGTSILTDDLGNTYSCCKAGGGPDTSAKGIGTNQDGKTDSQFKLDARDSAVATFELWGIRNGKDAPESFHYDISLDEMDFKNPKGVP